MATVTTFTFPGTVGRIPGLAPETTYSAVVRAVDGAGNRSAPSLAFAFATAAASIATFTDTAGTVDGLTPGGTYTFNVRAVDSAGNRSPVSGAVTVTLPLPPPATYAEATTVQAAVKMVTYTAEVTSAALPDPIIAKLGMDTYLSADVRTSAAPDTVGVLARVLTASPLGATSKDARVLVGVVNAVSRLGTVGVRFTAGVPLAADNPTGAALAWSASGLPAGLSIDPTSGLITGTPTSPGSYTVTATVRTAAGDVSSATFAWTVNP